MKTLRDIHTVEELEAKLGEIPYCKCGCGEKVTVTLTYGSIVGYNNKGYPKHIKGHASKKELLKLRPPRRKLQFAQKARTVKTVEDLEKFLGERPLCACGCGEKITVILSSYETIRKYFYKGYPKTNHGHSIRGINHPSHRPERKAMISEMMKDKWNDPEFKSKTRSAMHSAYKSPFFKLKWLRYVILLNIVRNKVTFKRKMG